MTKEIDTVHISSQELADAVYEEALKEEEAAGRRYGDATLLRANGEHDSVPAIDCAGGFSTDRGDDSHTLRGYCCRSTTRAKAPPSLVSEAELQERLRKIWSNANAGVKAAPPGFVTLEQLEQTLVVMDQRLDGVLQMCTDAVSAYESSEQKRHMLQDHLSQTTLEVERLRQANESYRKTMVSHIHASEATRIHHQEEAAAVRAAACLRAELASATKQFHDAVAQTEEANRKCALLEDQMHDLRTKFMRVTTEKFQLEREQRNALSLARHSTETDRSELEYYKKKVQELNLRCQRSNAVLAEKDRQLDEYRRQMERNLTGAQRLSAQHHR